MQSKYWPHPNWGRKIEVVQTSANSHHMKADARLAHQPELFSHDPADTPIVSRVVQEEAEGNVPAIGSGIFPLAGAPASTVTISVSGSKVILTGSVQSWAQYDEMERNAWSAPAITDVENFLTVDSLVQTSVAVS